MGFWSDFDIEVECPDCGHDGKYPEHEETWDGGLICGKCGHKIK